MFPFTLNPRTRTPLTTSKCRSRTCVVATTTSCPARAIRSAIWRITPATPPPTGGEDSQQNSNRMDLPLNLPSRPDVIAPSTEPGDARVTPSQAHHRPKRAKESPRAISDELPLQRFDARGSPRGHVRSGIARANPGARFLDHLAHRIELRMGRDQRKGLTGHGRDIPMDAAPRGRSHRPRHILR